MAESLPFPVDSRPPVHLLFFISLQLAIGWLSGPLSAVYLITTNVCAEGDDVFFAELLGTNFFLTGIHTIIQICLGLRLPVVQGSSYSFIPPLVAMMASEKWKCPERVVANTTLTTFERSPVYMTMGVNGTVLEPAWKPRIREVNGALMVASAVETLLGLTGAMGFLLRFIGPLTITPTIALIGLTLFKGPIRGMQHHWGIAFTTVAVILLSALVLGKIQIPLPNYSKEKKWHAVKYPLFRIMPYLLGMCAGWLLAHILTVTGSLPSDPSVRGYMARTDAKLGVIGRTKWIFLPYPGQWGTPTISSGVVLGMTAAMIASVVESLGDYYACARVCHVPSPPRHAVNRGIMMEGLGNILGGSMGLTAGTNTYSGSIGSIAITGLASRHVYFLGAIFMVCFGIFGKFGAALTVVPDPVTASMSMLGLGILTAIAMSNLRQVDMTSSRNAMILGLALMLGLILPEWMKENGDVIKTGSSELDQMIRVLLSTAMFVGGFVALVLDNLIPGTKEQRGLHGYIQDLTATDDVTDDDKNSDFKIYNLPFISGWLEKFSIFSYIPFLPSYKERSCCPKRSKKYSVDLEMDNKACNTEDEKRV